jgi:hypothetical protein
LQLWVVNIDLTINVLMMNTLHESQISKTRKITGYILSIIPSLMLLGAGISKVMKSEEMVKNFSSIPNFGDKVQLVGLIILVALSLYWIPKTSKIGFLLLCSFGGGVIVAEIVSGHAPIPGLMLTTLLYVGTILRRPSLIIV